MATGLSRGWRVDCREIVRPLSTGQVWWLKREREREGGKEGGREGGREGKRERERARAPKKAQLKEVKTEKFTHILFLCLAVADEEDLEHDLELLAV